MGACIQLGRAIMIDNLKVWRLAIIKFKLTSIGCGTMISILIHVKVLRIFNLVIDMVQLPHLDSYIQ